MENKPPVAPRDPKLCSLPNCRIPANGKDWILTKRVTDGEIIRFGYCSHAHTHIAHEFFAGIPHEVVMDSGPEDNYEDRARMGLLGLKKRRERGGDTQE